MIVLADMDDPTQTADVQADQGLRCPHMPEGMLSHGAANI